MMTSVMKPLVNTEVSEGKWDEVKTLLGTTARTINADVEQKIHYIQLKDYIDYKSTSTKGDQQIATTDIVEKHTTKSDLDNNLNNKRKWNANLHPVSERREICSELYASERKHIVLGGNDVCAITSGYETLDIESLPIKGIVIYDNANAKKSLRSKLDFHQLVQQIYMDLSLKLTPTVIKDKSDLLIKLSISDTYLQQDVMTARLKDALVSRWYKKIQIIFHNAPMEIDDGLFLKPSFFISDKNYVEVTPQVIEENNKLIISKKAGKYTYCHDKYDLIVTNALNADIEAGELCFIRFKDFYVEPKMQTLSIKFTDKEILLSKDINKIHNSHSIDELNTTSSVINSQPLEVTISKDINARDKLDRTLLHLASEAGEFDKAKLLLDRGAGIEVQDKFGYTPMFLATQSGRWSVVELLLDRGANIDAQDKEGHTLLHFAAQSDNLDMVQFVLDRGASIEVQDGHDWTPILYAAQSGKWGVVKLLIRNGAKFNNEITYKGTPLHFAVQDGNLDMVQFLLDKGADIESQDKDNRKPLHIAAEAGKLNVIKLLLDKGANVNAKDENNKTPLELATKEDIIQLLKRTMLKLGLSINSREGNLNKVKDIPAEGANLENQENKDNTPLGLSINGRNDQIKDVPAQGANLENIDNKDNTPLGLSINGRDDKVKNVPAQGANLEHKDNNHNTTLHNACNNGHLNIVEYLIEKAPNGDGKTPLDLATQKGFKDILQVIEQVKSDLDEKSLSAVKIGDLNELGDLVSQGENMDVQDSNGNTLLHCASQNGHLKVVEYLIRKGASLKTKNNDGKTPSDLAVQEGRTNIVEAIERVQLDLNKELLIAVNDDDLNKVKALVSQGATLEAKDNDDNTPLHKACNNGSAKLVEYLINEGASLKAKNKDGETPLHVASQRDGKLEAIEFILNRDLSCINDTTNDGRTPLHLAIQRNITDTIELLIKKGASITSKDNKGKTPIDLAKEEGHTNAIEMITKFLSNLDEKLLVAVKDNNRDEITDLLKHNANINTRDMYSWTPLHWAAYKGHLEVAELLVEKGANINAASENPYGSRSIHIAVENNNKNIVEFLLSRGVDVDDTDKLGYTPLHYAAWRGRLEIAQLLVDRKANINAEDISTSAKKPIHVAAEYNNESIIGFLLSKRISVDDADKHGWTPLHYAAKSGALQAARFLIEKHADINAEDMYGKKAIHVAVENNKTEIIEFLLSEKVSINDTDKEGHTLLYWASCIGQLDLVKYLINKGAIIDKASLDVAKDRKYHDITDYLQQSQLLLNGKLLAAIQGGDLNGVKDLVIRGAKLDTQDGYGRTPIQYAADNNRLDILKFLLDAGASINATGDVVKSPLDIDEDKGYSNISEHLEKNHDEIGDKYVLRRRSHHHAGHNRNYNHIAIDLGNQSEIVASSSVRPSSWINSCISWVKKIATSTFSIIPVLPTQYNIASKNDDVNVKGESNNTPKSISAIGWNNFLNSENVALASCVAGALNDTTSKRYHNLIRKEVEFIPSSKVAIEFALKKFNSFVEGKIRDLDSKEQARIRVEFKDAYPEIIASLGRGVEFSGNVGLDDVLVKCEKCFCTNFLH